MPTTKEQVEETDGWQPKDDQILVFDPNRPDVIAALERILRGKRNPDSPQTAANPSYGAIQSSKTRSRRIGLRLVFGRPALAVGVDT